MHKDNEGNNTFPNLLHFFKKGGFMAKDKVFELNYKIEGLKRMIKRKVKRGLKNRYKSINKEKQRNIDDDYFRW